MVQAMKCSRELGTVLLLLLAAFFVPATGQSTEPAEQQEVSYSRDIWPVIQRNCQGCHQPALKKGYLDLTSYEAFARGGMSGPVFAPGKPGESLVVAHLTGDQQPRMPVEEDPLSDEAIDLFRKWIEQGAEDDTPAQLSQRVVSGEPPTYRLPPVVTAIAYSLDGSRLAVSGYREVLLHSSDGSGLEARLLGLSDRIQTLIFLPDGKTLLATGGTPARFGEVQFWDLPSGRLKNSVTVCRDTLFGASVSPDSSKVAFGCSDKTVRVLEAGTGRELLKISQHENWVMGTVFTLDGNRIVSVGRDRAAKLVNASTGAFVENINLLRGGLTAIARHPSRSTVVIGGEDRIPFYYMTQRPRKMSINDDTTLIREFEKQAGEILGLAFSPDGRRIAVATASNSLPVYDVETGQRVLLCEGSQAGVYTVAFHPTGQQLAAGGFDGRVRVYATDSGEMLQEFVPVPIEESLRSSSRSAAAAGPQRGN
jgi:WD40 repeat protein